MPCMYGADIIWGLGVRLAVHTTQHTMGHDTKGQDTTGQDTTGQDTTVQDKTGQNRTHDATRLLPTWDMRVGLSLIWPMRLCMPGLVKTPPPCPSAAPRPGAGGAPVVGGAAPAAGAQGLGAGAVVSVEGVGAGAPAWPRRSWKGLGPPIALSTGSCTSRYILWRIAWGVEGEVVEVVMEVVVEMEVGVVEVKGFGGA